MLFTRSLSQIYDYVFSSPDNRDERGRRIERRHIKHFAPTAASILLLLHHDYLLLNRQIASEALEILLKSHTVFLCCGPYVLKTFLTKIESEAPRGRHWLKRMNKIELDWVTFPNLVHYPPDRTNGKDEWWWERDNIEVDVDYVTGFQASYSYDEYDYVGPNYDDNLYGAEDCTLYPEFPSQNTTTAATGPSANRGPNREPMDVFGFATHYPFSDPTTARGDDDDGDDTGTDDILEPEDKLISKLELLVALEVTPLFEYLSTPTFTLHSLTLPLYFISAKNLHHRSASRPDYPLPLRLRYWVHVAAHALRMLLHGHVNEVRIMYRPKDIWASMDPQDELQTIVERGVWFRPEEFEHGSGETWRAVWRACEQLGCVVQYGDLLDVEVGFVRWEGDLARWRVGDELEVVFTRRDR